MATPVLQPPTPIPPTRHRRGLVILVFVSVPHCVCVCGNLPFTQMGMVCHRCIDGRLFHFLGTVDIRQASRH
jgi:hypothetical protein